MEGLIGQAFVRLRPDLSGFRGEAEAGIKGQLAAAGQLTIPGLARAEGQLKGLGAAAKQSAVEQTNASRTVRTARQQEARDTVASAIQERRALEGNLAAYRALAAQAARGSRTEIEANRLAAQSAERLGLELTGVERRAIRASSSLNRLERGALAGSGAFRGMGRSVAFASLSFIGAYGLVGAIRGALEEAGDLNNQIARSETVFGRSDTAVQKWARDVGPELGFAKESALETANAFGTMFGAAGIGSQRSAQFAEDFARVAAALSLARGEADSSRADAALRVSLTGRGRALRQYGIILDQTSIKAKAAELGLIRSTVDPTKLVLAQRRLAEAVTALNEARSKGTQLQQAKAEDAVTVAQQRLAKTMQGTTGELTHQATAIAAHAIVMQQGQHFVARYGDSLDTAAGRSRRFHEGVSELKEELGTALYPEFTKAVTGIDAYIRSLGEGGSRHKEFEADLADAAAAAHDFYFGLRLVGHGLDDVASLVGGFGNLAEILGFAFAANKALKLAHDIRQSRLALLLLGEQAPATASSVVAAEAEMSAGALTLGGRIATARTAVGGLLGGLGRLAKIGTIAIAIDLIINKKDRDKAIDFLKGSPGSQQNKSLHDLINVGQGIADAATQIAKGNPFHTGHTLGYNRQHKKTQLDATNQATELRKANFGENVIYRLLVEDGFTERQAEYAILASRPSRRGFRAPSPEDARTEAGRPGSREAATPTTAREIRAGLAAIGKELDSGKKISQAKAKELGAALASIVGEIANSGFGPAERQKLVNEAKRMEIALADASAGLGQGAIAALETDRKKIRAKLDAIGQDIAQARVDMATAIKDAVTNAAQAEKDAVEQAKANLNSLGQSLSDFVGRFLDAQSQKTPTGPLAARLKELTKLIHSGQATPELIRKAQEVEAQLNAQQAKGGGGEAKKERIQRRLADLTDELNTGKISIARFNREVTALLRREGINYKAAGHSLGVAFADGFRVVLRELHEQAQAIADTPRRLRRQGTGLEVQIIRPLEVIKDQNRNIARVTAEQQSQLRDLIRRRHELLLQEQKNANLIAKSQRARLIALAQNRPKPQQAQRGGEPDRRRRGAPSPEDVRVGLRFQTSSVQGQARRSGRGIGAALGEGVETGIASYTERIAAAAAATVRRAVREARRAGRIHSPSDLTREEIGVPLAEGIEAGVQGLGGSLGATLAAQIRAASAEAQGEVKRRENAVQRRPRAEEILRDIHPVDRPERRAAAVALTREALPTVRRGPDGRLEHRGDREAYAQRSLLLGEERRHTRLLEQIVTEERKQTTLLREERPVRRAGAGRKKEQREASDAATATAVHNLLGS